MEDEIIKIKKVKEPKEENLLPVQVIMNDRVSALVEYEKNGVLTRATIAGKNIMDNKVKESILNKAVKFGIDWSELDYPSITAQEISRQLRIHGIWTAQDARTKPGIVSQSVIKACSPLVSTILGFIKDK
jgi:hypothetical protein